MSKLLPYYLLGYFLVLAVASLSFAADTAVQTASLEDFVVPAIEPVEAAAPEEPTPEKALGPAPKKEDVAIPYEDLLGFPNKMDSSDAEDIDLLIFPEDKDGDAKKQEEPGEDKVELDKVGDEPAEDKTKSGDGKEEPGNDADSGKADLQPIPSSESELAPEVDPEPVAAQPLPDYVPGGKRPSSWLSLNGSICSHWVRLSRTGELRGEINVLQNGGRARRVGELKVAIYRNAKRVGEEVTDKAGRFSFSRVKSGVYSLLVTGPDGFAAYGIHALAPLEASPAERDEEEDVESSDEEDVAQRRLNHDDVFHFAARKPAKVKPAKVSETLRITTAAVPPRSFGQLKAVIREYGKSLDPDDMSPPPSLPDDAWDELIATAVEEKRPGFDEPEGPEMYRGTKELEKNPVNHVRSPALGNFDVPLLRCGDGLVMRGRMVDTDPVNGRPLEVAEDSTTLTLIRNDQRVATTTVKAGGLFEFRNLSQGIYSIVAVGDVGFGAISFRAVEKENSAAKQANDNKSDVHFVQHPLNSDPCDPCNAPISGDFVIGGPAGAGGCSVPLCCDPACARDAVAFSRPRPIAAIAGATGLALGVAALADDPVELGGTTATAGGFTGVAGGGGGGGGAGIALGAAALGVGGAALALGNDDPVVSPSQ